MDSSKVRQPFTNLQYEIFKLLERNVSDEDLIETYEMNF